jgi:hypothetical protein
MKSPTGDIYFMAAFPGERRALENMTSMLHRAQLEYEHTDKLRQRAIVRDHNSRVFDDRLNNHHRRPFVNAAVRISNTRSFTVYLSDDVLQWVRPVLPDEDIQVDLDIDASTQKVLLDFTTNGRFKVGAYTTPGTYRRHKIQVGRALVDAGYVILGRADIPTYQWEDTTTLALFLGDSLQIVKDDPEAVKEHLDAVAKQRHAERDAVQSALDLLTEAVRDCDRAHDIWWDSKTRRYRVDWKEVPE